MKTQINKKQEIAFNDMCNLLSASLGISLEEASKKLVSIMEGMESSINEGILKSC